MNSLFFRNKLPSIGIAAFGMFLCSLIAFGTSGCATRTQVEEIVSRSNAALLNDSLTDPLEVNASLTPGKNPEGGSAVVPAWQTASSKIEQFAIAHSDQTTTVSALRLRQAIMLLANDQFESARIAFGQATELHTARDSALKALSEDLIWWFALDKGFDTTPSFATAEGALNNFQTQISNLSTDAKNEGIRDYLAEMRAWIGLHYLENEPNAVEAKRIMELTFNEYAKIFDETDLDAVQNGSIGSSQDPLGTRVRRQTRALSVIAAAKEQSASIEADGMSVQLSEDARAFGELIRPD